MKFTSTIKWGIYLGISVALATQILTWAGLGFTSWFVLITYLLVILVSILWCLQSRRQPGGLKLLPGIASFGLIILIGRLIFQLYMFVYTRFIDPGWVDTVAVSWSETMQNNGVSPADIDAQIDAFRLAYQALPMFTIELVKFGIPQFILGILVVLGFAMYDKWRKKD